LEKHLPSANLFPAFISDEYRPGTGFPEFESSARASGDRVRRQFETDFAAIKRIAQDALSVPRNAAGSLDLGVDQYRAAATAAHAQAQALREIETAAVRAARAAGDHSEETRRFIQATRAARLEGEATARSEGQRVVAMERLQAAMNETVSRTQAVAASNRGLRSSQDMVAAGARQSRFAYVQFGQQFSDVVVQMQMGTPIHQVMVQQLTQMGFAASGLPGKLGAIGRFFAGPLGTIAILGAAAGVSQLTKAFGGSEKAAKGAASASELFGEAQSALGTLFDLTTGKLKTQNEFLREHIDLLKAEIRLKALDLQDQALADEDKFLSSRAAIGRSSIDAGGAIVRGIGAERGSPQLAGRVDPGLQADAAAIERIFKAVESGSLSITKAQERLQGMAEQARRLGLELKGDEGLLRTLVKGDMARARRELAAKMLSSVDAERLDPSLRTPDTKDRSSQIDRLGEAGRDALDKVEGIAGRFADAPRVVQQAEAAYRDLANVQRDLIRDNNELIKVSGRPIASFDEVMARIAETQKQLPFDVARKLAEPFEQAPKRFEAAADALRAYDEMAAKLDARKPTDGSLLDFIAGKKKTVREGLAAPLDDYIRQLERSQSVQEAINAGQLEEADFLREKYQLMQAVGAQTEEDLDRYLQTVGYQGDINGFLREQVALVREQGRAYEALQARIGPYLSAIDQVRSNLTSTIEASLSNPFRGAKDFAVGLKQTFNSLFAEDMAEKLFGQTFRDLERKIRETPAEKEANERVKRFSGTVETGATALERLSSAVNTAADNVLQAAERMATGSPAQALSAAASARSSTALTAGLSSLMRSGGLPVGGKITNTFAQHVARGSAGLDIAAALGSAIRAPAGGKVVTVGRDPKSGNYVVLDHGGGIISSYSHLLKRPSISGLVRAGDQIGQVGVTGRTTGPHLHYRVKVGGEDVDPLGFRFPTLSKPAKVANDNLASLAATVAGLSETAEEATNEIVVTAIRPLQKALGAAGTGGDKGFSSVEALTPARMFGNMFHQLFTGGAIELGINPKSAERIGVKIGAVAEKVGAIFPYAQMAASLTSSLSDLIGVKDRTSIFGGILGNIALDQMIPAKRASASISFSGGQLVSTTTGNSKKFKAGSTEGAESAITNIMRIAEALGGTITGTGAVSIGIREGSYRVDPTGKGITKTKKGAIDFGEDAAAAVKAATLNLIQDGMIAGLRAGTQRLLQNAKDLEAGLDKALRFEGVFRELKRRTNPVGAALDDLNRNFESLKHIFEQAGASAEEYADLQKLYELERVDAIEQATANLTSTLKGLIDDLTINNDALSLRDRLAAAKARYDPLAAEFGAGNYAHADAFAEAGRAVEAITRQIEGSQAGYFDFLASFTDLARKGLAHQEGLISGATGGPSPFAPADNTPVVGAIDRLGNHLAGELGGHLRAVNDNLGTLISRITGSGGSGSSRLAQFAPLVGRDNF
jgi:murein DD-endopeptidase MepM/ murein hydrolase activator NlpD